MESNEPKAEQSINLTFRPGRRLLGPDVKIRAVGGVVPTRREVEEELQIRLQYGVGKY